jgi:soluble lytic murein transglycosylase-like protein
MLNYSLYSGEGRRRLNWRLFLGSNAALFLIAFFIVDLRMGDLSRSVVESKPAEAAIIPVTIVPDAGNTEGSAAVQLHRAHLARPNDIRSSIRPWQPYIQKYSREFGVDPDLVAAILYIESRGDPYSVSGKGAMGLMQITPATASHLGISDVFDPEQNIKAGVKYIAHLIRTYDESLALLVYNAGAGTLEQNRVPRETKQFIERVQFLKSFLKDIKKLNDLS